MSTNPPGTLRSDRPLLLAASVAMALSSCHQPPQPETAAAREDSTRIEAPAALESTSDPMGTPPPAPDSPAPSTLEPELDATLAEHFAAEGMTGTIALYETLHAGADARSTFRYVCSDLERCSRGYLPASTFKIPNSLIGLETGVLESSETPLPWDGRTYTVPAWNQDHTLRTAIAVSCVPCYQRIARGIGATRMKSWLDRLDYGNRQSTPELERFWLNGDLRITPREQVDFLWRLREHQLPVSDHSREIVLDILTLDRTDATVLRAKTGLESDVPVGWYVGWVEAPGRTVYFATMIDGADRLEDIAPARKRITAHALRQWANLGIPDQ